MATAIGPAEVLLGDLHGHWRRAGMAGRNQSAKSIRYPARDLGSKTPPVPPPLTDTTTAPMDSIQAEFDRLANTENLSKVLGDIDKVLALAQNARDQIAASACPQLELPR